MDLTWVLPFAIRLDADAVTLAELRAALASPLSALAMLAATLATIIFIAYAVCTRSKTIGALAQFGGLQERDLARRSLESPPASPNASSPRASSAAASPTAEIVGPSRRLAERACFTIGVVNVALTTFLVGAHPTSFFLWHSPKAVLLIVSRWVAFRREKPARHLLLLDFCYFANFLSLIYCWIWPRSHELFQVLFLAANGPVAWSVLAFNQALVFHSWQHITSVFIHVSPMLLTYGLRWRADPRFVICDGDCADAEPGVMLMSALTKFYLWWLVLYYVVVFIFLGRYVKSRGFQTLFDRVSVSGPLAPLLRRLTRENESELQLIKKAAYIAVHFACGTATMMLAATLFWRSRAAHLAFIITMCCASAWNASSFYFEVVRHAPRTQLQSSPPEPQLAAPQVGEEKKDQ